MNKYLAELLNNNNISNDLVEEKLYRMLLSACLLKVVIFLEDSNEKANYMAAMRIFRDKKRYIEKLVKHVCGWKLSEEEVSWLCRCLEARLSKKGTRENIELSIRQQIIKDQLGKCSYCKRDITLENSHADHIIPWTLVGDELEDNIQMLCPDCNKKKSDRIDFDFLRVFLEI